MSETPSAATPDNDLPICVAINICNEIIVDARTGNKSLINCFTGIGVQQLPALHPRFFIMASITNVVQNTELVVSARDPNYNEVMQFRAQIPAGEALMVHDLMIEVYNLQLPIAGPYFIDVTHNDELLAERSFGVQVIQPQPMPGQAPGAGYPGGGLPGQMPPPQMPQ